MNFLMQNETNCREWNFSEDLHNRSREKLIRRQSIVGIISGIIIILFSLSTEVLAQECPSFQLAEISDTQNDTSNGKVIFKIRGTRRYSAKSFEVRQKQKNVTGPLDFDIDLKVVGDELTIDGLKPSDELYLDEYVILFSDRSCNNGEVLEVGTFKIN